MKALAPWCLLIVAALARAQPPLPPEERPRTIGMVLRFSEADGIALDGGLSAPLAPGVVLTGAPGLGAVVVGDLVEISQDENGLVATVTLIPKLSARAPLAEVVAGRVPLPRFWWTHEDHDYPDSLYASDLVVPLQVAALSLEATIAYLPQDIEDAVEFAVLDSEGVVVWSRRIGAGEVAELRCPLHKGGSLTLRCQRADGSTPDNTQCIWGSPVLLLRQPGLLCLPPQVATQLVGALAANLGNLDPGAVAIARPRVLGVADETALDLAQDLFSALGRRYRVTGLLAVPATDELTDAQRQAATSIGAEAVAVAELRYAPEAPTVELALVSVAGQEVLARATATVAP